RFQHVAELAAALVPFAPAPRAQLYADRCAAAMRSAAIGAAAGEVQAKEVDARLQAEPAEPAATIEVHPRIDVQGPSGPLRTAAPAPPAAVAVAAAARPRLTPVQPVAPSLPAGV